MFHQVNNVQTFVCQSFLEVVHLQCPCITFYIQSQVFLQPWFCNFLPTLTLQGSVPLLRFPMFESCSPLRSPSSTCVLCFILCSCSPVLLSTENSVYICKAGLNHNTRGEVVETQVWVNNWRKHRQPHKNRVTTELRL